MKLTDVPFDEIKNGTVVRGASGKRGKIIEKWTQPDRFDERYISIQWDDGTETSNWYLWMDKITIEEA